MAVALIMGASLNTAANARRSMSDFAVFFMILLPFKLYQKAFLITVGFALFILSNSASKIKRFFR